MVSLFLSVCDEEQHTKKSDMPHPTDTKNESKHPILGGRPLPTLKITGFFILLDLISCVAILPLLLPPQKKWWAFASCTIQRYCHTHTTYNDTKPTSEPYPIIGYGHTVGAQCIVLVVLKIGSFLNRAQ